MELRHLRVFVAVADELHFGRAAHRLHLTQPSVSGQIRQLETELGVRLFTRSARQVMLTGPGKAFLDDARRIVQQVETAAVSVREQRSRDGGRLRIGYVADALPRALPVALRRLASGGASPDVELFSGEPSVLVARVRDRSLDAAILSLPASTKGLDVVAFAQEDAVIAFSTASSEGREDEVPLEIVANGTVLSRPRRTNPGFHDCVTAAFSTAQLPSPIREIEGATVEHLLLRVAAGGGMALIPGSVAEQVKTPGVRFRKLVQDARVGCSLAVVSAPSVEHRGINAFVSALAAPEVSTLHQPALVAA